MRNCEAGAKACCGTRGWRQGQIPRKVARNSIGRSFNKVRKRCNSNDLNSMFEIVAGELRAKLGAVSAMRQVRSGRDTCAVAAVPAGGGGAWPGFETPHQATDQRPGTTGVEGTEGTCRGAGGRRRGLAGLFTTT